MGVTTFNEMEIDAIGEIMNISLGASATAVSTMLGTAVDITTPVVSVVDGKDFEFRKIEPAIGTEISYVEGLSGRNVMMFSRNDVRVIVGILMGMEIPMEQFELDEINRSAVCEVMNQMMGSSATALSEFLGYPVNISTPVSFEISDNDMFKEKYFREDERKIVVRFNLEIKDKIKSEFLNIMSTDLAKKLLEPFGIPSGDLSAPVQEAVSQPEEPAPQPTSQPEAAPSSGGGMLSQAEIEALMAGGITEEPAPQPAAAPASGGTLSQAEIEALMAGGIAEEPAPQPAPVVQPVVEAPVMAQPMAAPVQMVAPAMDPMMLQLLSQMQQSQMQMMEMMNNMKKEEKPKPEPTSSSIIRPINPAQLDDGVTDGDEENVNQEMLLKVPLEVSVEIGRTKKLVKDILEYTQGSLVVLDKMAGEQADLYVNGRCIAKGDIVVVEDNFGIRITEIVSRNLNPETL